MRSAPLLILVLALGIVAGVVFLAWPGIDLWLARQFYLAPTEFTLSRSPAAALIRGSVKALTIALIVSLPLALAVALIRRRPVLGLGARALVFLILAFAIGPGLIVNAVLKEHWGRARPSQIVELGGARTFTPALVVSDQCRSNCAFTSGDAALGFAVTAFAFVVPRRRLLVFIGGMALGSLYGAVRTMQGGHFLSDIVFSCVFTLLPILLLNHLLLERRWTPPWPPANRHPA